MDIKVRWLWLSFKRSKDAFLAGESICSVELIL